MNRDDILQLPAGKEMDRLIVDLMGWTQIDKAIHYNVSLGIRWAEQEDGIWKFEPGLAHLWSPSTQIYDAWEVVETMRTRYTFAINDTHAQWRAMFVPVPKPSTWYFQVPDIFFTAWEDTAPLAISRALLLAVLV